MLHTIFVSDTQVAERYNVGRATVWRWSRNGLLPKPVHLSPGCTRWDTAELDEADTDKRANHRAA